MDGNACGHGVAVEQATTKNQEGTWFENQRHGICKSFDYDLSLYF